MTTELLTVRMEDTLRHAAELMVERNVGAAVVPAEETGARPEIVTERVLTECVAKNVDVDTKPVGEHLSSSLTYRHRIGRSSRRPRR